LVFLLMRISKKGECVIKYIGQIVGKDPSNAYTMKYQYFDIWVDASKKSYDTCLTKYINHSCNPNCKNVMWAMKEMPWLCFFATRDIKMGEEITFDYGWTLSEASLNRGLGTKCLCREKDCSGTIESTINRKGT
jgi:SET domain-containing protein